MATIRKLRGRWQAQVRRRGMAPRAKSFDQKADAEKWARSLESELDRCGMLPDTRVTETATHRPILERYTREFSPREAQRPHRDLADKGAPASPTLSQGLGTAVDLESRDLSRRTASVGLAQPESDAAKAIERAEDSASDDAATVSISRL